MIFQPRSRTATSPPALCPTPHINENKILVEAPITAYIAPVNGVSLPAGNCKDAGAQDVGKLIDDPAGIVAIRDYHRWVLGDSKAVLHSGQKA